MPFEGLHENPLVSENRNVDLYHAYHTFTPYSCRYSPAEASKVSLCLRKPHVCHGGMRHSKIDARRGVGSTA